MAIGKGFVFQNAVLKRANHCWTFGLNPFCRGVLSGGALTYGTTYEGGMLTLNPSGPWRKNFKAKNVTATNISCHDRIREVFGFSNWTMDWTIPKIKKSTYSFDIQASFNVEPDNYEVKTDPDDGMVFQVGYDFDATITIIESW